MDYLTLLIVVILVSLSGLFSGLTLGLLGLDKTTLEIKIRAGDKRAKKVYSVRKNGNLLLCTLLLGNVAVNSALAIFLGNLASGVIAGIISTGLIVIFGEIIPQATVSKYAIDIGAKTVRLVQFFMIILYPISWPIAKLLDKFLGEEMPTIWSKQELKEMIKIHESSPISEIDRDEKRIIHGALEFSETTVNEIMTPKKDVFMLEINQVLDKEIKRIIKKIGFSRIPIYKDNLNNIVGVLYVKDLIELSGRKKVKDVYKEGFILKIKEDLKLDLLLNKFLRKKIHLAAVYNKNNEFIGVISLEDIIEEIIKKEIIDEDDSNIK